MHNETHCFTNDQYVLPSTDKFSSTGSDHRTISRGLNVRGRCNQTGEWADANLGFGRWTFHDLLLKSKCRLHQCKLTDHCWASLWKASAFVLARRQG